MPISTSHFFGLVSYYGVDLMLLYALRSQDADKRMAQGMIAGALEFGIFDHVAVRFAQGIFF